MDDPTIETSPPRRRFRVRTGQLLMLMMPLAVCFWRMADDRRFEESQCRFHLSVPIYGQLKLIRVKNGHYPPAVTFDPSDRPLHSWRTLTHLVIDSSDFKYDLTQPWDAPANRPYSTTPPWGFSCRNNQGWWGQSTHYVAVVDGGVSTLDRADAIPDGSPAAADQPLLIEYPNSDILWSEPRDLDVTELPKLGDGGDCGGLGVLFADGRFRRLPQREVLKLFGR